MDLYTGLRTDPDPDPALVVLGFRDANKKSFLLSFCLLLTVGTFTTGMIIQAAFYFKFISDPDPAKSFGSDRIRIRNEFEIKLLRKTSKN